MHLTDNHIEKLKELGVGWKLTRIARNSVCLGYFSPDDEYQARVMIKRKHDGTYDVEGSVTSSFSGSHYDFYAFSDLCKHRSAKLDELVTSVRRYLQSEVDNCRKLTPEQMQAISELAHGFGQWIEKPPRVYQGLYGVTVIDPILETMFSAENIDLALRGGRLEADIDQKGEILIWVSQDYLKPLAADMADHLAKKGSAVSVSDAQYLFLNDLGEAISG